MAQITLFRRFLENGDSNRKAERWNLSSKYETHFDSKIAWFFISYFLNIGSSGSTSENTICLVLLSLTLFQPEVIPGVEKFTDSFNGSFTSDQGSTKALQRQNENEQVLMKRTTELKRLNEQQLLSEIKALKERAYR